MMHIEYYESSACNLDFWRVPPPPPLCVPLSWPVWTSSFMSECVCVNERRWMSVCVKTDTVVPPVTAGCSCSSAAWCSLWSSLSPHLRRPLLCVCLTASRSWADDGVNHLLEKKSLRCQWVYFHEQICVTCACMCATHVMNKPRVTSFWSVTYISKRSPWKELTGGN